jgi:protein-S-isoprenylcysteine O-methyltransferase Ste14
MEKLSFFGIGPRIGSIAIPWLVISIIFTQLYKPLFSFVPEKSKLLFYTGIGLTALGFILYFSTIRLLLKGLKETRLVTNGAFYLCCNPLYSSLILLVIPGFSLIMNSWLIITTSLAGYILFKWHIKNEARELDKFFGEKYQKYKEETPEFFPFPYKKWFK